MPEIEETVLPGVGVRHDFVTRAGTRVGIITHHNGRRELLVYEHEDPDACKDVVRLDEDETRAMADLLGGSSLVQRLDDVRQNVEGLTLDWVPLRPESPFAGRLIGDTKLRTRTGTTVIAIVRDGQTRPAPGPDAEMRAGDTLVLVGTPDGMIKANELLRGD